MYGSRTNATAMTSVRLPSSFCLHAAIYLDECLTAALFDELAQTAYGWYDVTCQYGTEGYIRSDLLVLTSNPTSGKGSSIVETALKHLGTRYVYGGASAGGFDCSGFTMYIYKQFGYNLPHSATSQWLSGMGTKITSISELQPGDLVFFNDPSRNAGKACSHAGIYIGNGQHIHASSSRGGGVIISDMTSGYYNTYFVGGLRLS